MSNALEHLRKSVYSADFNEPTTDLAGLAMGYATARENIREAEDARRLLQLYEQGRQRFADELRLFGFDVQNMDIIDAEAAAEPLTANSTPEVFCYFKGVLFGSLSPANMQCIGALVYACKPCSGKVHGCDENQAVGPLRADSDWLAEIGDFLRSDQPCQKCRDLAAKDVHPKAVQLSVGWVNPAFQQIAPSGKKLEDGHEMESWQPANIQTTPHENDEDEHDPFCDCDACKAAERAEVERLRNRYKRS